MDKKIRFQGLSPDAIDEESGGVATSRVFLLSPAYMLGKRIKALCRDNNESDVRRRLREGRLPLAELFCFASSLYFKGKLSYAQRFSSPPLGVGGCFIITSSRGLLAPDSLVDSKLLADLSADIDPDDDCYRIPLQRDAAILAEQLGKHGQAVLLGSIATTKYVKPLLEILGKQLLYPAGFVGLGNMSRGRLLLRCTRDGKELRYISAAGCV